MSRYLFATLIICFLFGLLWSCANVGRLSGGEKDEQAPRLIESESTPNFQTNFTDRSFKLTFDEWIRLEDVFNQVIVSPPLRFRPAVTLKKRTVNFEFDEEEVLREEATYVINFGEAIVDLTEGNETEMVFVFSTGDFIDSLTVTGQIVDALSEEPVEDVLFLMYENTADSVFKTERPFYFAKTDDEGRFEVKNVKSGVFKGTALIDLNLNYLFDNPGGESIGFLDSTILVSDSTQPDVRLKLFLEEETLFLRNDEQDRYGLVNLIFNRMPHDAEVEYDTLGQFIHIEQVFDTIKVWYDMDSTMSWNLYVKNDTIVDTVFVKMPSRNAFLEKAQLKLQNAKADPSPRKLNPSKSLKFEFNHPLYVFDTTGIFLWEDSTKIRVLPKIVVDSIEQRTMVISYPWKGEKLYELEILPNRIMDQFGLVNQDTIRRSYNALPTKEFGNIGLKVLDLKPDTNYVVRLLLDRNLVEEVSTKGSPIFEKRYSMLAPGVYDVEIIEDVDGNGRWSTGNYDLKKHPERVFTKILEELRANWDVEAEMSVEEQGTVETSDDS